MVMECFLSCLYPYQYPGCNIALQFPRHYHWGKLGNGNMGYVYYFGEGNGNPLQYSCLENPMDGGAS